MCSHYQSEKRPVFYVKRFGIKLPPEREPPLPFLAPDSLGWAARWVCNWLACSATVYRSRDRLVLQLEDLGF